MRGLLLARDRFWYARFWQVVLYRRGTSAIYPVRREQRWRQGRQLWQKTVIITHDATTLAKLLVRLWWRLDSTSSSTMIILDDHLHPLHMDRRRSSATSTCSQMNDTEWIKAATTNREAGSLPVVHQFSLETYSTRSSLSMFLQYAHFGSVPKE